MGRPRDFVRRYLKRRMSTEFCLPEISLGQSTERNLFIDSALE